MIDWNTLRDQTVTLRKAIALTVAEEGPRADVIPPTWNNNLRWQVGHLVVTAHRITRGLMREPVGVDTDWSRAFSKGTSPSDWEDPASLPSLERLADALVADVPGLFDAFEARQDDPFPEPYTTSAGVTLGTPAEALTFSLAHDAMHLGMILALRRGLAAMDGAA